MAFTEAEVAYISSQPLLRIASVSAEGQPDVVPVSFEFDGFHFFIGGFDPERARRTKNVDQGNAKVALVIDDLASVRPWSPRFLRVYGVAELVRRDGRAGSPRIMKVTPEVSWSYNLDGSWHAGGVMPATPTKTHHAP